MAAKTGWQPLRSGKRIAREAHLLRQRCRANGGARPEVVVADGIAYSISRSGQTYAPTAVWTTSSH
jgi:hypothetical protein